jgi:hypothetical protein
MALGSGPFFFVHQAYNQWRELPAVAAATPQGTRSPGLVASYNNVPAKSVDELVNNRGQLMPCLADPGSLRYGHPRIRQSPTGSWIGRSAPTSSAAWDRNVRDAFQAQRALGVDALLTPTIELLPGDYPNHFQRVVGAARRAQTALQTGDPPVFARFILRQEWLDDGNMRRVLLDQLTDLPDPFGIALQIRWGRNNLADAAAVNALKASVRILVSDGRRVLLTNSGLLGWLSLAWGVWGFSAGLSGASWHDNTVEIRRRRGQPSVPRVPRYFSAPLMAVLTRDELRTASAQAGRCQCTFCNSLNPLGSAQWNHLLAQQHGLRTLALLTGQVSGSESNRQQAVRKQIEGAQRRWRAMQLREPPHLQAWLDAL